MSEPSNDRSPDRRARKWRFLSLLSGLLLAACFFLPAVRGCNVPIVPATDFVETIKEAAFNDWPIEQATILAVYVVAYAFGAALLVGALASLLAWPRLQKAGSAAKALLLAYAAIVPLTLSTCEILRGNWPPFDTLENGVTSAMGTLGALLLITAVVLAIRRPHQRRLCFCFLGGISGLVWFGFWAVFGDPLYGLYLSLAACLAIVFAAVGEAAVLTGQPWLRAFGQLLTCRLAPSRRRRAIAPVAITTSTV
jgi:hypothetical protein